VTDAADEAAARPSSLLVVQLWDALLVCLAFLEVLGVFGTSLPGIVQVLYALQGATFMASIVIVMMALTRRLAWVRLAQIAVLAISAGFSVAVLATQVARHTDGTDLSSLPGTALLVLVSALVIVLLTAPKLRAWYMLPGAMPSWMRGTIALWVAGCVATVAAQAFT
jgi:hypothetical protein